ncbi:hypothetical protein TKK_0001425 [Trichogramma kaykai]
MELPAMLLPVFEELINLDASERPLDTNLSKLSTVRLLGKGKSIGQLKKAHTVQMINCPFEKAIIRCSLVTADSNRFLHPYCLVRRNDTSDLDNHYDEEVSDKNNFTATFDDIRIIITIKKKNRCQIRLTTENEMKCINVNSASLSFQGFYYEPNNILYPLTDSIYSQSVNNSRNASTGKLEIYRSSKSTGSTLGDEEVWLLVQKVEKTNIKIKFLEVDYDGEPIWQADGKFSESDNSGIYEIHFTYIPMCVSQNEN